MAWVYLLIAGLLEMGWAVTLKYTDGFTRLWPTVGTVILMILSFVALAQAVRTLPLGTAYAVWTGMGVVGTVIYGMVFWHEPRDLFRVVCLLLVLLGIMGLKVASGAKG